MSDDRPPVVVSADTWDWLRGHMKRQAQAARCAKRGGRCRCGPWSICRIEAEQIVDDSLKGFREELARIRVEHKQRKTRAARQARLKAAQQQQADDGDGR